MQIAITSEAKRMIVEQGNIISAKIDRKVAFG